MPHRYTRIQFVCLLLFLALNLSGCSYLAENWTKPIGVHDQSKKSTTVHAQQTERAAPVSLAISEVMSNNVGSMILSDGTTPGWIELYNVSDREINLNEYMLSDNIKKPNKYVFTSGTLAAGSYLLVYSDARDPKAYVIGSEIHLPFGISSSGEELLLTSPDGTTADRWIIPALPADISYGINGQDTKPGSAKVYFGAPTPGKVNGTDGKPTLDSPATSLAR